MRNRTKSATPATRNFIDTQVEDTKLPPEQTPPVVEPEKPPVETTPPETQADDDSWLDGLTPYETEQQTNQEQEQPPVQQTSTPQHEDDKGTEEQQRRLAELYAGLEHIDEDVADEVRSKLVEPELNKLRAELAELHQYRQQEQKSKRDAIIADINAKIIAKHPKADKILRSKEFMDYVNTDTNPYATSDTEFNFLMRAYYAGDAEYVISKIDGFVSSRGKPKPPVGVEPQQGMGRSGVADTPSGKKVMSEAEYLAKRSAIKKAPKGTYPPGALKDLVNEYLNSRG